jgi:hypothetical protein
MSFFNVKASWLLKPYIDTQFLLLRLEKLKKIASDRILDADEAKELNECIAKYSEIQKGVVDVSAKENKDLLERAKSLIQGVQELGWTRQELARVQAERKAIAEGNAELGRKAERERVRKAYVKSNTDNVGEVIIWARWKKPDDGKYFYQNLQTQKVFWDLDVGTRFIDGETGKRDTQGGIDGIEERIRDIQGGNVSDGRNPLSMAQSGQFV